MSRVATITEGLRGNPVRLLVFLRTFVVTGLALFILYVQGTELIERHFQYSRADFSSSYLLWSVPLCFGLAAEFLSFRTARLVNVGYYAFCALYPLASYALGPGGFLAFHPISRGELIDAFILFSLPCFAIAAILMLLYHYTSPSRLAVSDAG